MASGAPPSSVLLNGVAVIAALIVFSGTFLAHIPRGQPGSYLPIGVGSLAFMILMFAVNFAATRAKSMRGRLLQSIGVALVESVVFIFLLLFLLVNSFGS
jgi:hypothetical protein